MSTFPDDRDKAYLWDMRAGAARVQQLVWGATFDEFEPDSMLRLAVERAVELIGEAARRVSREFRLAHPEIPWQDIIGQRNVLAHDYGEIDGRRLWETATKDINDLVTSIDALLTNSH